MTDVTDPKQEMTQAVEQAAAPCLSCPSFKLACSSLVRLANDAVQGKLEYMIWHDRLVGMVEAAFEAGLAAGARIERQRRTAADPAKAELRRRAWALWRKRAHVPAMIVPGGMHRA